MKDPWIDALGAIATGVVLVFVVGYFLLAMMGVDPSSWVLAIAAIVFCLLVTQLNGHAQSAPKSGKQ